MMQKEIADFETKVNSASNKVYYDGSLYDKLNSKSLIIGDTSKLGLCVPFTTMWLVCAYNKKKIQPFFNYR
jgi:hypothetical protein